MTALLHPPEMERLLANLTKLHRTNSNHIVRMQRLVTLTARNAEETGRQRVIAQAINELGQADDNIMQACAWIVEAT